MKHRIIKALREAKKTIETVGWAKGQFHGEDGGCCTLTALRLAYSLCVYDDSEDAEFEAYWLTCQNFCRANNIPFMENVPREDENIAGWNDLEGVSQYVVLNAFDKAIALTERLKQ